MKSSLFFYDFCDWEQLSNCGHPLDLQTGSILVRGFTILLGLQLSGTLLSKWLALPLPGSVVGMVLMLLVLRFGLVKLAWVVDASELLLKNLSMLFVPAGVGVMVYFELISQQWLSLTVATVVSTVAALATTGLTAKFLSSKGGRS